MTEESELRTILVGVDGRTYALDVRTDETLLETLRDRCGATSVRYCCGIGVCGTCTVLLDGEAVSSCLLLTVMAEGRRVTTPQGLPAGASTVSTVSTVSTAQQAFVDAGAFQCSYCIPGMALAAQAAVDRDPGMSVQSLAHELAGNLCRCGSYPQIREALERLVGGPAGDTPTTPEGAPS